MAVNRPTHKCGHDAFAGMTTEQVGWQLEDMASAMPNADYASINEWIADAASRRCDSCEDAALDAFTESVAHMDNTGPREA